MAVEGPLNDEFDNILRIARRETNERSSEKLQRRLKELYEDFQSFPEEEEAGSRWAQGVATEWAAELEDRRQDIYMMEDGEALRRLPCGPHPESVQLAEEDFEEWARSLPTDDTETLVDPSKGTPVHWTPERGWVKGPE